LGIAIVVWWAFAMWPVHGLLAFVVLSVFHFGRTDAIAEGRGGVGPVAAVVAIAGPFVFWQADAVRYLGWVGIPADLASRFSPAMAAATVLGAVAISVIYAIASVRASATQSRDTGSLLQRHPTALWVALPALSLPPAAGFAVYFCALHAMRHWRQLREEGIDLPRTPILATTVVTLLLGALALWLSSLSSHTATFNIAPIWAGVARVLVIGLAALTVPHMLLDAVLRRRTQPMLR
jgi:beta-carotene 15,15'-dioxygenase